MLHAHGSAAQSVEAFRNGAEGRLAKQAEMVPIGGGATYTTARKKWTSSPAGCGLHHLHPTLEGNDVNKKNLLAGLPVALALASPMVAAESNYPEPFEPKVLYQNAELIATYANRPSLAVTSAAAPAPSAPVSEASAAANMPVYTKEESALAQNFPILLLAAGLFGALIWVSKRSDRQGSVSSPAPRLLDDAPAVVASVVVGFAGETGVSKYLEKLPAPAVVSSTGVAKYLRRLPPPVVVEPVQTGVTRYLKKLPKPPILPTDESGVAKYLKSL